MHCCITARFWFYPLFLLSVFHTRDGWKQANYIYLIWKDIYISSVGSLKSPKTSVIFAVIDECFLSTCHPMCFLQANCACSVPVSILRGLITTLSLRDGLSGAAVLTPALSQRRLSLAPARPLLRGLKCLPGEPRLGSWSAGCSYSPHCLCSFNQRAESKPSLTWSVKYTWITQITNVHLLLMT